MHTVYRTVVTISKYIYIYIHMTFLIFLIYKLDLFILFYVYFLWIYVCVLCVYLVTEEAREVHWGLRNWSMNSYETPCVCWESNLDPLQEQRVLLTAEPSLHLQYETFRQHIYLHIHRHTPYSLNIHVYIYAYMHTYTGIKCTR